jgi:hypothetical protein
MNDTERGVTSMLRSRNSKILLGTLVSTALVALLAVSVRAGETERAAQEAPRPTARVRIPSEIDPANYRSRFTPDNFGKTKADEVRRKYDVDLAFPEKALGGEYQGVWVGPSSTDGYGDGFVVVYSNDVKVSITHWSTAKDAREFLGTFTAGLPAAYAPYVKEVSVGGQAGYAVSMVDVPPVPINETDPETGLGRTKPGTGLYIGQSTIAWSQGRYVVAISSDSFPPDDLLPIAETLRVRPNRPEPDEATGYWDKPVE